MTPDLFRRSRSALGLSVEGMAAALGLGPASGSRTVRRWEAGTSTITGPVRLACIHLLRERGAADYEQGYGARGIASYQRFYELAREIEEEQIATEKFWRGVSEERNT